MVKEIRLLLRENPFFRKTIYGLVHKVGNALRIKQRWIRKYGYDAVSRIDAAASKTEMPYYANYGTLLGFVRDGGFIKHDTDLDFSIPPEGYRLVKKFYMELVKNGFYFERFFLFDGRLQEFSVRYREISIDFFLQCYSDDKQHIVYIGERRDGYWMHFHYPVVCKTVLFHLRGISVRIPENYESLLNAEYGDWKEKVARWDDSMAPCFSKDYSNHKLAFSRVLPEWEDFLEKNFA